MAAQQGSSSNDTLASIVLLLATVAALIVANSAAADLYKATLAASIGFDVGPFDLSDTLKNWIKNALMAVFFLYVGLEIKAEFAEGSLSERSRAILPFAGAVGGMALPAALFLAWTFGDAALMRGWAIPSATDIAFAVGIVGLLGRRVPLPLKAFLLAVAVIDDLGAILIIAFFYTDTLHLWALAASAVTIGVLFAMNRGGVERLWPYLIVGLVLWVLVLQSGINATLAGVIVALFVPLHRKDGKGHPLHDLVSSLKTPVVFFIMPVFAFANAGVSLAGLGLADLTQPVTAGIISGLVIGKPIGITLAVFVVVAIGVARLPEETTWLRMIGVGCIAGIGFTMSLFVGALAYADDALLNQVRLGVLVGSLISTLLGVGILMLARAPAR